MDFLHFIQDVSKKHNLDYITARLLSIVIFIRHTDEGIKQRWISNKIFNPIDDSLMLFGLLLFFFYLFLFFQVI